MTRAATVTAVEMEDPSDFVAILVEEATGEDDGFFMVQRNGSESGSVAVSRTVARGPHNDLASVLVLDHSTDSDSPDMLSVSSRPASAADNASVMSNNSELSLHSLSGAGWTTDDLLPREEGDHDTVRLEMFRDPEAQIGRCAVDPALSRLIKRGFDSSLRPSIWLALTGANALRAEGLYQQLLEYADSMTPVLETHSGPQYTAHKRDLRQIELDITRTLCKDAHFGPHAPGRRQLRRLLSAYAWRNQEIGYCQGLNVIAGILLLELGNEEDTYWALVGLVENILPQRYFTRDMSGVSEDTQKFQGYVEVLLPALYQHFTKLGIDVAVISLGWFLTLYAECVDRATLYRLWDRLLLDGSDFLHGVGLGLLRTFRTQLLATKELSELLIILQRMSEGGKTGGPKFLKNVSKMEVRLSKIRPRQQSTVIK